MLFLWRGKGIVALLCGLFGGFIFTVLATSTDQYNSKVITGVCALIGGAVAAGLCWWHGKKLADPANDRQLVDKATGHDVVLRSRHTFMLTPVHCWAYVWGGLFTLAALANFYLALKGA